eukprot:scaffold63495_cov39-Phaeocystis_antarctica.AAC.2
MEGPTCYQPIPQSKQSLVSPAVRAHQLARLASTSPRWTAPPPPRPPRRPRPPPGAPSAA